MRLFVLIETLTSLLIEYLNTRSLASVALLYTERALILGPLWIKIGQVLASRQDILGKEACQYLEVLTDKVPETFSINEARLMIKEDFRDVAIAQELLLNLSNETVACASLAQVYKSRLNSIGEVAVKIQRPDIRAIISTDFIFAKFLASLLAHFGIVKADLIGAVDEYGSRLYEEIDYANEKMNIVKFNKLYDNDIGTAARTLPKPGLCIPKAISGLCSDRIITMTWIDCLKLNDKNQQFSSQDLALIKLGIRSTLSQLLDTGIMHADCHAGNLLKEKDTNRLVYLDFGLVATIPQVVKESLICSILYFIERDIENLANQFDGLMLLPKDSLSSQEQLEFQQSLLEIINKIFKDIDEAKKTIKTTTKRAQSLTNLPRIRFDQLIFDLLTVATKYKFTVPPYFLNNARALASLEGIALIADPNFNLLQELYPYVLKRIILGQEESPKIRKAFRELTLHNVNGYMVPNWNRIKRLHDDIISIGLDKRELYLQFAKIILFTKPGMSLIKEVSYSYASILLRKVRSIWKGLKKLHA